MVIVALYTRSHSVVFYNHRCRIKEETYFQAFQNFFEINFPGAEWFAVTFTKGTLRDYFIIVNPKHQQGLEAALDALMKDEWKAIFRRYK